MGHQIPTVRHRRLAAELRKLRADAQLTREEVADATSMNESTLWRIETAKGRPQKRTLKALLDLYCVGEVQRAEITALSQGAKEPGWLRPFHSELPEEYTTYISFESEAWEIRNYQSLFIPGLLQTEDYARAVIRGTLPMVSESEVESRVQARVERPGVVFEKSEPLRLWAIVDEAAVRRTVGSEGVMKGQLRHLTDMAQRPYVRLQVVPFTGGAHPGMTGSFCLLSFADREEPEIVYLDTMAGDLFRESEIDIRRFRGMFDQVGAQALSPADTLKLISSLV
ncbi:helix-turn-helix domain-containing protein [Streptomyces sedi]|uniref:Helix-turn-helix domain-containing protein n=1 Tax=Streptomyces sedi TaxID=555059 RepID=A0A5C4UVS5_9ACTN|nr:helix-turn-helix transcriptional regulator [Streptomyces sedi]TNM27069.1 helix-turn-helix domain-containing protein [Streptomyces sedi]